MRKLNKKQKTLIEDYYENNTNLACIDNSLIVKLENINNYETLLHDANRYYGDLKMNAKQEKLYNSDYAKFKRGEL